MKILLLSAYDTGSHRYWRQGLVDHLTEHEWHVRTLPPRHFSWRIRGNPISWLDDTGSSLPHPFDALVVTSMVDLATLRGINPRLANIPALVYFHENQFAYPSGADRKARLEPAMVNLYSALAADRVVFNSEWNRCSFLQGVSSMLAGFPDYSPQSIAQRLAQSCKVLPVPLEDKFPPMLIPECPGSQPLTIAWNHRWEYDKAPERLYAALCKLQQRGVAFRLYLLGNRFRSVPPAFEQIKRKFSHELMQFGSVTDRDEYLQCLHCADVVVSTALQEFQGLALLEGINCGCVPVAPDRLSYPEFVQAAFLYDSFPDAADTEASALADKLHEMAALHAGPGLPSPPAIEHLRWSRLASQYRSLLGTLSAEKRPGSHIRNVP